MANPVNRDGVKITKGMIGPLEAAISGHPLPAPGYPGTRDERGRTARTTSWEEEQCQPVREYTARVN
jgi:hypothetical protein